MISLRNFRIGEKKILEYELFYFLFSIFYFFLIFFLSFFFNFFSTFLVSVDNTFLSRTHRYAAPITCMLKTGRIW
mgnify:CR=1 FL=1